MIIQGLADLAYQIFRIFFFLLPSYSPPAGQGLSILSAANVVLPLSELALIMGAVVAYATASLLYTGIMRMLKFLRGAG